MTQEVLIAIKEEVISINIPGGVAEGMQLSMSGKRKMKTPGGIRR